jgi:hypothetical protein
MGQVVHYVGNLAYVTWDLAQFFIPLWLQEIQRPLRYSTFFTGTKKDRDRIRVRQDRLLQSVRKLYENPASRPGTQVLGERELGFREIANVRRLLIWLDDSVVPPPVRYPTEPASEQCDCSICLAVEWGFHLASKAAKRKG